MALDAREGTHPIVQTVNTIDEANLAFDTITYEKGLAVIRMLEAYVGEEDFRTGVRNYLNSRLYGNARTEDLWTRRAGRLRPAGARHRAQLHRPARLSGAGVDGGDCARAAARQRECSIDAAPFRHGRRLAHAPSAGRIPVVVRRVGAGEPRELCVGRKPTGMHPVDESLRPLSRQRRPKRLLPRALRPRQFRAR